MVFFKRAYASHACLVPIDGYFEWQTLDSSVKKKQLGAIANEVGQVIRVGRPR
ncbi:MULTISPECIES: SOS response-associated peptidase [unclassified Mesorhizobium]|uniref:SOS response-associated peptidase n=1 Tax=unclassified Mesorhizobium TaxID=325217 RepID=UPI0012058638|nr:MULTISPECIES: SOS response-associated peptidase [unclassified Mesorhizobium]TIQ62016.1 MAG: SOS response-associated peptidase [Mesorhizobium sp.]TIQ66757.1 MAG: SOS response-associated peptidase [Mesorhizobium sp.]